MHLHTMRALFASHDAFSALFASCIQPQLQVTVLRPGFLYESFLSASPTCHKNNLHPIGDLQLLMLTSTILISPDLPGSSFDVIPTIGAIFEALLASLKATRSLPSDQ